jgi:HAE1 family hydrophobic/amphiphilic exporter-1
MDMSYQEKIVRHQMYFIYLVLAGQYESSVVFSVPLALVGPVLAISALHIRQQLYTQIGSWARSSPWHSPIVWGASQ